MGDSRQAAGEEEGGAVSVNQVSLILERGTFQLEHQWVQMELRRGVTKALITN